MLSPAASMLDHVSAPTFAVSIARAVEILGEDEELLRDLVDGMDPEDGWLWIRGTGNEETITFTTGGWTVSERCWRTISAAGRRCDPDRMLTPE